MSPGEAPRGRPCRLALGLNPPLGSGSMQFLEDPAKSQGGVKGVSVLKGCWLPLRGHGEVLLTLESVFWSWQRVVFP